MHVRYTIGRSGKEAEEEEVDFIGAVSLDLQALKSELFGLRSQLDECLEKSHKLCQRVERKMQQLCDKGNTATSGTDTKGRNKRIPLLQEQKPTPTALIWEASTTFFPSFEEVKEEEEDLAVAAEAVGLPSDLKVRYVFSIVNRLELGHNSQNTHSI